MPYPHKTRKAMLQPGPRLQALLNTGVAWWSDRGTVVARASDGMVVTLGCSPFFGFIEEYLEAHPSPSDW